MLRLHSARPPHHARATGATDCDQLHKIFEPDDINIMVGETYALC